MPIGINSIGLPTEDPIEFLFRNKFPAYKAYQMPHSLMGNDGGPSFEQREEYLGRANAYKARLNGLSDEDLNRQYVEAKRTAAELQIAKQAAQEQNRPFNQPSANADLTHWAKATYWTLEEAIALSFEKSPEVVNWQLLESLQRISPFVAEYAKVRDLAIRAKNWGQLYDPVNPGIFLAWAKRNDVGFPDELESLVVKYG